MEDNNSIEIRKIKKINLRGGTVIDGFPSVCLTNSIACECLIRSLKTELVAVLSSNSFPAISVIHNNMPNFPARIYANEDLKLAIFVSEINLDPAMYYSISNMMLQWAQDNECGLIISAAGISNESDKTMMQESNSSSTGNTGSNIDSSSSNITNSIEKTIYAVASTPRALKRAIDVNIPALSTGWITGIPAILLNEGAWKNIDVIVLLSQTLKDVPDFRAAAAICGEIKKLAPLISCEFSSILKQAEEIERELKKLRVDQTNSGLNIYG